MNNGYIKLWRSSTDNPLYFSEPFTKWQAWCDLLILANHKKNTVSVRGILVTVEPGQVLAGEEFLAKRWKWSRGKVRRFMSHLSSKTVQQIVQQKNNVCTLLSIVNWNQYQSGGTANGTADGTTDRQQTVQQTDIPKNDKNEENEKNISAGSADPTENDSSRKKKDPNSEWALELSKRLISGVSEKLDQKLTSRPNGKPFLLMLKDNVCEKDALERAVDFVIAHTGEDFFPDIQSSRAFREKWGQIVAAKKRMDKERKVIFK